MRRTLQRGFKHCRAVRKVSFRESNFDVNGKNWIIDKDGEIVISDSTVTAKGIKLYNGLQEIQLTSVPSNSGQRHRP